MPRFLDKLKGRDHIVEKTEPQVETASRLFVFQLAYFEPPLAVGQKGLVIATDSMVALDRALEMVNRDYYPLAYARVYEADVDVHGFKASRSSHIRFVDGRNDELIFVGMGELAAQWSSPKWLAVTAPQLKLVYGVPHAERPVTDEPQPLVEVFRE